MLPFVAKKTEKLADEARDVIPISLSWRLFNDREL
jgi:hypothetical protein